jgi:hypothetical protein
MSDLGHVELGGYIAWEGRAHRRTITVAMGIALVRPLWPTSPAPLRRRTVALLTPLCPSHARDVGQAPCPLMDPGASWSGDSQARTSAAIPPTTTPNLSPVCLG